MRFSFCSSSHFFFSFISLFVNFWLFLSSFFYFKQNFVESFYSGGFDVSLSSFSPPSSPSPSSSSLLSYISSSSFLSFSSSDDLSFLSSFRRRRRRNENISTRISSVRLHHDVFSTNIRNADNYFNTNKFISSSSSSFANPEVVAMSSSPSTSSSSSSSTSSSSSVSVFPSSSSVGDLSSSSNSNRNSTLSNGFDVRKPLKSQYEHVSEKVAQMLYEDMLMGRSVEDLCAQMYYRGRVTGFVHLYSGQEAVSTGVIKALRPDDFVVSTYRAHVHSVSKGVPAREVFAELYGKESGCSKGRGGSMHMFSKKYGLIGGFAYIGEQIPIACGFAFSSAFRKYTGSREKKKSNDQVTICFMGDGATNMGQFYEAMNIAAVAKLPIVFVIENNNWAIGMAHYRSTSVPEIYKKAESFGIPGVEVDGMNVLAVRSAARKAIDRARRGEGPSLIEALTYRFRGHSLADPDELRANLEKQAWVSRDPILTFGSYMKKMGYANDATLKLAQKKVRKIVEDAVKFAEESPEPKVEDVGRHIFADAYVPQPETFTADELHGYTEALKAELDYQERRKGGDKTPLTPIQYSRNPMTIID